MLCCHSMGNILRRTILLYRSARNCSREDPEQPKNNTSTFLKKEKDLYLNARSDFIMDQCWKLPKCPSIAEWVNKL